MMNDGNEIVTTLTKLFWATDHHDWEGLRRTFAGQVLLDYTATLGGEPRICAPGEVVDGWRPAFEALDAHQHLVANHMVEIADEEATATASFIATHQFQGGSRDHHRVAGDVTHRGRIAEDLGGAVPDEEIGGDDAQDGQQRCLQTRQSVHDGAMYLSRRNRSQGGRTG